MQLNWYLLILFLEVVKVVLVVVVVVEVVVEVVVITAVVVVVLTIVVDVIVVCPMSGIGYGMMMVCMLFNAFYNVILAWCIYYIIGSCSTQLPWTTCNNWWNTPLCEEETTSITNVSSHSDHQANVTAVAAVVNNVSAGGAAVDVDAWSNDTLSHTSVEEFWQ